MKEETDPLKDFQPHTIAMADEIIELVGFNCGIEDCDHLISIFKGASDRLTDSIERQRLTGKEIPFWDEVKKAIEIKYKYWNYE